MSLALDFICPLPNGVHARPAVALVKTARAFLSEITLTNTRTGQSANSKSLLAVVSAGIRSSDTCRLSVSGSDETEAMQVLSSFLSKDFPGCDGEPRITSAFVANAHQPAPADLACSLFDPALIVTDAECRTKAEAIKLAVNLLHLTGRTKRPRELEQSIWQRESVDSTGFGHGFAIPHCSSEAVLANSLVILKSRTPMDWESADRRPVNFIILMAIRQADHSDRHMTIFSRLARKLMDGAFREQITGEPDSNALSVFLNRSLNN